jgi:Raf kinase inhibitor-like YbhB/YbcL family protein
MRNSTSIALCLVALPVLASAGPNKTLTVTSDAFKAGEAIPTEYTCEGASKAPPLSWSGVPSEAKSVAILVEDPDAPKGTFTHWIVTNIPASETSLSGALPAGAMAAKNDKGAIGYAAPCPPSGTHHYHFHVFALDKTIEQPPNRAAFMKEMKGHVLAHGDLIGTVSKTEAQKTNGTNR